MPIVGQFGSLAGFGMFPGGAFESIATVTLGSGGAGNVEFTSIPGTFQHLQLRIMARITSGTNTFFDGQFNGDTASNYTWHDIQGNGSAASTGAAANRSAFVAGYVSLATDEFVGAVIIDILDYGSTSKNKTVRAFGGHDKNGTGIVTVQSGLWRSTSAVTSLKLTNPSGTIGQHSTFALYGVRG
jgi:hypothetical protein